MSVDELTLPMKRVKATSNSPKKLLIFSKPKAGKTSALAALDNALILDLENGTDFLDAMKVKANSLEDIKKIGEAIKAKGKPYKYIVIDTVTKLEDMVMPLAVKLYQATAMGKGFTGDNVLSLPNGAGYLYHREAFFKMTNYIETWADRIIYLGHLKAKYIEKNGKEVSSAEVDLIGKVKSMLCADVDAIGLLYRESEGVNILSFETTDDVICGARPDHLKNKKIVLSEVTKDGLKVNWDKVYID